jgi:MFS family permease
MAKTRSTEPDGTRQPQAARPVTPAVPGTLAPNSAATHGARNRTVGAISHTLESLKHPAYRYMWGGSMLGMGGMQMQSIARTVFVDELTGSAFLTGLVALGFAPTMLIMSLFGGVAGDRLERRMVIQVSQAAAGVLALVVAVLIALDAVHWVHLFFASMLQGVTFAFQMPARQAILPNLVGKENVTNAIALNSAGMGITTIVAPGVAGVLYGLAGPETVYFAVAGMAAVAVLFTSRLPRFVPDPGGVKKGVFSDISAGLRYTWQNRLVLMLLISGLTMAVLAIPFGMQVPVLARRLYAIEAAEIGWLMASMGVGGLLATVITANLRAGHHRGAVLLFVGMGGTGLAVLLMAVSHVYFIGMAILVLVGFAGSIRMTLGQSLMIEATSDEFRARVMSLNMMVFGLAPVGALPLGYSIDHLGAEKTLVILGLVLSVATALLIIGSSTLRRHS